MPERKTKKREAPVGRSSTAVVGTARSGGGSGEIRLNKNQSEIINELTSKGEEWETETIVLQRLRGSAPDNKKDFKKWSEEYNQRVDRNNKLGRELVELQNKFSKTIDRSNRELVSFGIDSLSSARDESQKRAGKKLQDAYIPKGSEIKIR
jgi:hypothetical protein